MEKNAQFGGLHVIGLKFFSLFSKQNVFFWHLAYWYIRELKLLNNILIVT